MPNKRIRKKRNIRRLKTGSSHSPNEEKILNASIVTASSKAFRTSRALKLQIKVIRNGKIISINPDDSITEIKTIDSHAKKLKGLKKAITLNKKPNSPSKNICQTNG